MSRVDALSASNNEALSGSDIIEASSMMTTS